MYKLLIIEDFFFDRENAKSIVDWSSFGIEVIGAVENGMVAAEFIAAEKPDILLSDIKMPEMDGVELAGLVLDKYPWIKVVFMSYSNEFKYARDAIKLDVVDYITKPLLKDEVAGVMQRTVDQLNREKAEKREKEELKGRLLESFPLLRERFLRNLLTGTAYDEEGIWKQIEYLAIDVQKGLYQLIVIEIDEYDQRHTLESKENAQFMGLRISDMIDRERSAPDTVNKILIQTDEYHYAVLVNQPHPAKEDDLERASRLLAQNSLAAVNSASNASISVIIGDVFHQLHDVGRRYFGCLEAIRYKFYVGKGNLIYQRDVPEEYGYISFNINQLKSDLNNILFGEENELIYKLIDTYVNHNKYPSENSVKSTAYSMVIYMQLTLLEMGISCVDIFGNDLIIWDELLRINTIQEIRQWLYNVFQQTRKYLVCKNRKNAHKIVCSVQKYVNDNLSKEITIQLIAKDIYLSPNYVNLLFKNETGETIPDYIARQRVEKAKTLLADPKLKLYEITEMVGYNHLPYFNGIFKKYAGMTMKEYRNVL